MKPDESPAAELWRRTLSQIPSLFGRLIYLASLRDPNTGTYRHFGFAQRFTEKEADRTLRRSHRNTFSDWLCFSLEEQKSDLEKHLNSLEEDARAVIANWTRFPPFVTCIPAEAREVERALFLSDLNLVLEAFRREFGVASADRDS